MRACVLDVGATNAAAAAAVAMMMHEFVWRIVVLATHAFDAKIARFSDLCDYGLASEAVVCYS